MNDDEWEKEEYLKQQRVFLKKDIDFEQVKTH